MELQEMQEQLMEWLNNTHRYKVHKSEDCMIVDDASNIITIKLFTSVNEYSIRSQLPVEGRKGYLGCTATCRTPRAGETWTRGSDLPDGDFSEETWNKIMFNIVGYELVKIHHPISENR